MKELPENKFGYLLLKGAKNGKGIYIKANKITSFDYEEGKDDILVVTVVGEFSYLVTDTIDEILEQLDNIHPSLR